MQQRGTPLLQAPGSPTACLCSAAGAMKWREDRMRVSVRFADCASKSRWHGSATLHMSSCQCFYGTAWFVINKAPSGARIHDCALQALNTLCQMRYCWVWPRGLPASQGMSPSKFMGQPLYGAHPLSQCCCSKVMLMRCTTWHNIASAFNWGSFVPAHCFNRYWLHQNPDTEKVIDNAWQGFTPHPCQD